MSSSVPATPQPSVTPPVRPLAKGTLGRRLVVRVAVLVAVVAIGLSTVVALAAYNIQISQIDNRLGLALNRQTRPDDGGRGGPSPGGQVIGTITAVQTGGTASGVILVDKSSTSAPVGFETRREAQLQLGIRRCDLPRGVEHAPLVLDALARVVVAGVDAQLTPPADGEHRSAQHDERPEGLQLVVGEG